MVLLYSLIEGGSLLDDLGVSFPVVAVQVVVFVAAILLMSKYLFGPVTEFTRKRKEELEADAAAVAKRRAEVEKLSAEYEQRIAEIEKEAYERLQDAIRKGQEQKAKILAEAEGEARAELEAARSEIEKEKEAAKAALRDEVKKLALEAARRLTGRTYDPARHAKIVEEILEEKSS